VKRPLLAGVGAAALACAVVAATVAPGGAALSSARVNGTASTAAATEVSWNWSGYVVTGLGSTAFTASTTTVFKSVTATWKQPAARCTGARSSASAIWVGLGGYSTGSDTLEQAGTSADCRPTGEASYYAWYELMPPSITIKNFKVMPGDTITASVVVNGNDVLLWVKNRTRHRVFSKHVKLRDPDLTSAEWITEAPAECTPPDNNCRQLPLANFGSVTFTKVAALATIEGLGDQGGTISSTFWQATPIRLVPERTERDFGDNQGPGSVTAAAGAKPIGLSADGSSFKVSWQAKPAGLGSG
jgi:hypothetical protein